MREILIKDASLVNEGKVIQKDLLISGETIALICDSIPPLASMEVINAKGLHLLPGWIDDQVHFREPGLTHKGTIASESRAAVAGGITSFLEMPNTIPQTTNHKVLMEKHAIAAKSSIANFGFLFGGTNENLKEIIQIDESEVAGIKLFLGSSTGKMLVDDQKVLEEIFSKTTLPIAVHCEDELTIKKNLSKYIYKYGDNIPIEKHHKIRSENACYLSSSKAIEIAKKNRCKITRFSFIYS